MTEPEIRAKSIEFAAIAPWGRAPTEREILVRAELFRVYIRDGMEGCEGMLKMPPWSHTA